MGNACSCIQGINRGQPKRKVALAILGIDGAGKTTTTKALVGDSLEVAPTIGFNTENLKVNKFDVTIFDIGGGKNVRNIWTDYFHEVYGIIYVVDSSSTGRMAEVRENLKALLEHPQVSGKPLLFLANKSDLENALESVDVCEKVNLEEQVNLYKCPCRIESTCAVKGTGKKVDPKLKEGMKWICGIIQHNWQQYSDRVERDMEQQRVKDEGEKEARRERVRKIREEREMEEKEERERLGIQEPRSDEEDEDTGNPFKPVNVEELERKQKRLKDEKRRVNELGNRHKMKDEDRRRISREEDNNNDDDDVDSDDLTVNRSHRSPRHFNLSNGDALTQSYDIHDDKRNRLRQRSHQTTHVVEDEDEDSDIDIRPRGRKLTPRLPPLQRPLGTKFMDETETTKKKKSKKQKLRSLVEIDDETDDPFKKSVGSLSKINVSARGNSFNNDDRDEEEESEDAGDDLRANRGYSKRLQVAGYDNLTNTRNTKYGKQENSLYNSGADSRFRNQENSLYNSGADSRFRNQENSLYNSGVDSRSGNRENSLYNSGVDSRSGNQENSLYNSGADSRFGNRENSLYNNGADSRFGNHDNLYGNNTKNSQLRDHDSPLYKNDAQNGQLGMYNSTYSRQNGDVEEDSDVQKSQKKKVGKKKGKNRTPREFSNTVVDHNDTNDSDDGYLKKQRGYNLPPVGGEEDTDDMTPVRRLKKKQPYTVKKNRTFPSDNSDEDVPDTRPRDYSWTTSPSKTKPDQRNISPVHISRTNWGLAEDMSDESSDDQGHHNIRMMRRSRPNMDDDDVVY